MVRNLLANRGSVNEHNHLCRPKRRPGFFGWTLDSGGIRYASPSESSHQKQDEPTVPPFSSQNPPAASVSSSTSKPWSQNTPTTQGPQTREQQAPNTAISVQGNNQSVVLFGVKGPRITLELAQIDTVKHSKDNLFFLTLRQEYKQRRGKLRYWLSVWRLSHCDFVKVSSNNLSSGIKCLVISV